MPDPTGATCLGGVYVMPHDATFLTKSTMTPVSTDRLRVSRPTRRDPPPSCPNVASMRLGTLDWSPALHSPDLVAAPVLATLRSAAEQGGEHEQAARAVLVTPIDPELADTAAMTEAYGLTLEISGNCVLVAGARAGEERVAACVVRATTRADVNTTVRKRLDVRKASFLPMETAVADTGMEYGGITPLGLPERYRVMVDASLTAAENVIIGSGIRGSKLVLPGSAIAILADAEIVEGLGR